MTDPIKQAMDALEQTTASLRMFVREVGVDPGVNAFAAIYQGDRAIAALSALQQATSPDQRDGVSRCPAGCDFEELEIGTESESVMAVFGAPYRRLRCGKCGFNKDGDPVPGEVKDAVAKWNEAVAARHAEAALRQSAPAVPEGWKLVPFEPTEAMVHDGAHAVLDGGQSGTLARAVWEAMLSAAPPSPSDHPADVERGDDDSRRTPDYHRAMNAVRDLAAEYGTRTKQED